MKLLLAMIALVSVWSGIVQTSESLPATPLILVVQAYPVTSMYANQSYNDQYYNRDLQKLMYFNRLKAAVPPHLTDHATSISDENEWNTSILERIEKLKQ